MYTVKKVVEIYEKINSKTFLKIKMRKMNILYFGAESFIFGTLKPLDSIKYHQKLQPLEKVSVYTSSHLKRRLISTN